MLRHHRNRMCAGGGGPTPIQDFRPNEDACSFYDTFQGAGGLRNSGAEYSERGWSAWDIENNHNGYLRGTGPMAMVSGKAAYLGDVIPNRAEMVAGGFHYMVKFQVGGGSTDYGVFAPNDGWYSYKNPGPTLIFTFWNDQIVMRKWQSNSSGSSLKSWNFTETSTWIILDMYFSGDMIYLILFDGITGALIASLSTSYAFTFAERGIVMKPNNSFQQVDWICATKDSPENLGIIWEGM